MTMTQRPCPVCGAADRDTLYDNEMAALGELDMSYRVGECARCGFVHAAQLPGPQAYERYYARYSRYDQSTVVSAFDAARAEAAVGLVAGAVPRDATVVDVGCGHGALLARLQQAGFVDLHGVDPAPQAALRAREAFGLEGVRRGTMATCHEVAPLAQAGLVLVMAVLEHLWDPKADLGGLLRHLPAGCRVLVEVPALDSFDGTRGEPLGELSQEHIQFFSTASLDAFMGTLGARPLRHAIVDLASIEVHTLFGLYEVGAPAAVPAPQREDGARMRRYVAASLERLAQALAKVPAGEIAVYGAGAHTARLLPRLAQRGTRVRFVADRNPNLVGSTLGGHPIVPPDEIARHPQLPVLVSSYRFQNEIARQLAGRFPNERITLY